MAKRTQKRASRRSYDEDEFNDDELKERFVDDEDDDYQDDYDREEEEEEDEEEEDEEEEEEQRPRRSSRKKSTSKKHVSEPAPNKEVRLKAFWAVYSQNYQRVEVFDYADKKKAEARAKELTDSNSKKNEYFVKMEKKVIES